ncbi:hypothetical protein [Kordia sp.]|uniref:hypothetical protein n=1 Tax=Kordia sp. TaxID=1965332 RepID=UPI003B5BFDB1
MEQLNAIVQGVHAHNIPEETYFRKLLFQVMLNTGNEVTATLLLDIFKKSFTSEAIIFDEKWNRIEEPLPFQDTTMMNTNEAFEFTINTIQFLIADLRRLGNKVLNDPNRGFGVSSSVGTRWYNFDITAIVDGWNGFYATGSDISTKDTTNTSEYTWCDIADILLIGKGYE